MHFYYKFPIITENSFFESVFILTIINPKKIKLPTLFWQRRYKNLMFHKLQGCSLYTKERDRFCKAIRKQFFRKSISTFRLGFYKRPIKWRTSQNGYYRTIACFRKRLSMYILRYISNVAGRTVYPVSLYRSQLH